jgi:nickel/cobalt exporter
MELDSFGIFGVYSAALVLGMMHAIEPGHGKTVVAAYLVGSRGRNLDALLLGIVVTFTHSFSIIVLGVIAKVSSRYFTDQVLHAYLGLFASILILGIGLWMLKTRWAALRNPSIAHHHGHHSHAHNHNNNQNNHHHDNHSAHHIHHEDKPPGLVGLILLGISGGIVPCPAALAILLASASVGDIGKGLVLVIIFSVGLACSLVAIGLVVVNSVKFAQRFLDTKKFVAKISFASAGIITMIGVFTLYSSLRHFGVV